MIAADFPLFDVFLSLLWFFAMLIWFLVVAGVLIDVFRDQDMSGWAKAVWFAFVLFVPVVGVLAYLLVRGPKLRQRADAEFGEGFGEWERGGCEMTATGLAPTRFTDVEMAQLLDLALESDSVELKFTVADSHHRSTIKALRIDPLDAQVRLVYFFDTPNLDLEQHGLVVRARRIQGRGDDSVVKLRPVVPHELPDGVRRSDNVTVEVDALPGGFVCSAAMKRVMGPEVIKEVMDGERPLRKLFSKEQSAFYAAHAPAGIALDDLSTLGPILVLKVRTPATAEFGRKLVTELWHYPDNTMILELSTKTVPPEAMQVAVEARAFLAKHGVDMTGEQRTKTKTALEFFAGVLAGTSAEASS